MRIGIALPNNWGIENIDDLLAIGVEADRLGFDALWSSEHLVNLSYVRDRIGDGPYYSSLAVLSALAVQTSRIKLGTSVLVLPFHNPFFVAKYFASLDHLSKGRAALGVGIGNVPEEFSVVGVPWKRRGALTDEGLSVIRALWTPGAATHKGALWNFSDVHTSPKAFGSPIPIWIGGISPAAMHRTASMGDGWHGVALGPEAFSSHVAEIEDRAAEFGREPGAIAFSMRMNIAFEGEGASENEMKAVIDATRPDDIKGVVECYADAGASDMIFALNCRDPEHVKLTIRHIADALSEHLGPRRNV